MRRRRGRAGRNGELDTSGCHSLRGLAGQNGDVVCRVHGALGQALQGLGRCPIQRAHRFNGCIGDCGIDAVKLQRGGNDAGAQGFRQEEHVSRPRPAVGEHALGVDCSCDGVTELDLRILDRVAAKQRNPGLAQLVEAALEDRANRVVVQSFFERPRLPTLSAAGRPLRTHLWRALPRRSRHKYWIVDDRREEIDRLHQRRSALPSDTPRIVRSPEIDKDPVVSGHRYGAQHLSELAAREFARSTGAGNHLRQTLGHGSFQTTNTAKLAQLEGPEFLCLFGVFCG